jgi:hypothetical protein
MISSFAGTASVLTLALLAGSAMLVVVALSPQWISPILTSAGVPDTSLSLLEYSKDNNVGGEEALLHLTPAWVRWKDYIPHAATLSSSDGVAVDLACEHCRSDH